jgi:hypothetical protein
VAGLRPDVVLMGAGESRKEIYDYAGRLMRAWGFPAIVSSTTKLSRLADIVFECDFGNKNRASVIYRLRGSRLCLEVFSGSCPMVRFGAWCTHVHSIEL